MQRIMKARNAGVVTPGLVWSLVLWTPALCNGHPGLHHDIERLTTLIEQQPNRADLYIQRSHYLRLDDHPIEALQDLDRAREIEPGRRDIAVHRGIVLGVLQRDDEALAELAAFLDSGPGSAIAYAERAKLKLRRGERSPAVTDYLSAIALDPDVELYIECGRLQTELGWLDEAAALYREAISTLGEAEVIVQCLVEVEVRRQEYAEAIALVDRQLANGAAKSVWLRRRAEIWDRAGDSAAAAKDRADALQIADQALVRRPDAINLVARAEVFFSMGRFVEAREDLLAAVKKAPRYHKASELLARINKELDSK